jgi:hypothetical protein
VRYTENIVEPVNMDFRRTILRNPIFLTLFLSAVLALTCAVGPMAVEPDTLSASDKCEQSGVVTLQSTAKTSSSDGADVTVFRLLNHSGVVHAVILNNTSQEQPISARFQELQADAYDVYQDSALIGSFTRDQLEKGIQVKLPGIVLQQDRPLIQKIEEDSASLVKSLKSDKRPGASLALAMLANIGNWCRTADGRIRNSGGAYIILNPGGKILSSPIGWSRPSSESVTSDTAKFWKAIMDQREILYSSVKDTDIRDSAISAITPVDLTAQTSSGSTAPIVKCKIVNQCEATISGTILLEKPNQSKSALTKAFALLPRQRSFDAEFKLPPGEAQEQLKVYARVKIGKAEFVKYITVKAE